MPEGNINAEVAEHLRELVPEARIGIAHGQMGERDLEHVMREFYAQRFNLLVCSTIIETGIDVPTANTIIIDRADRFGLAQLHQLRGRVGRSHHQAYAYLLTPPEGALSLQAKKRLEAIQSMEQMLDQLKNTAKNASSTITMKRPSTKLPEVTSSGVTPRSSCTFAATL